MFCSYGSNPCPQMQEAGAQEVCAPEAGAPEVIFTVGIKQSRRQEYITMKAGKWIGIGVLITLGIIVMGIAVLGLVSRFGFWHSPVMAAPGNRWTSRNGFACDGSGYSMGSGMMGGWSQPGQCDVGTPGSMMGDSSPVEGGAAGQLTIEEAQQALEQYLVNRNDSNLEIAEVMEFDKNFYAIISEKDTGTGAMELLVNKWRGTVSPEIGPNMMWNTKYGMHGRGGMMGRPATNPTNSLTEEAAVNVAQSWLDENFRGATTEGHADSFYGYYTFHFLKDGEIAGMFSVHGATGQVWYHSWHGDFIQMTEGDATP
ncbi:MAG: hypothetical protein E4H27_06115 [Anaerolineales bacterium]|nr:MAG: hypothetical protein E4H27_06115 [Anaerolineales bacterium]